ncbi:response regulator [Zhouia spongiae]|uniref:histidine kinase n=1 Tax=Zhouia spongiae TaxID=2202721 RepID=A0ABY3YND6_9FLAO|nr:response regulator [Zhouia spongiae]UNY99006.1 response regulator [Zhouia spongiae]
MKLLLQYITALMLFPCLGFAYAGNAASDSLNSLEQRFFEYKNKGDFNKASLSLASAYEIATANEDSESIIDICNLYTELFLDYDQFEKAGVYIETAKRALNLYDYKRGEAVSKSFEAIYLAKNGEKDEAVDLLKEAKKIVPKRDLSTNNQVLFNEAIMYMYLENFNRAKRIFQRLLPFQGDYEEEYLTAKALLYLATIDLDKNYLESTELHLTRLLTIVNDNGFMKLKLEASKLASALFEKERKYELALEYLKQAEAINKTYFSNDILNSQREAANNSQLDFLTRLNDQLKKDAVKQEQTVNISKLTSVLSSALLIIISLLTISLYRNNQIKFKTNDLLLKKNLELQVAKDSAERAMQAKAQFLSTVSHELRTPLYAVTGLTHLLLEEDPKDSQKDHLKSLKYSGEYLLNFINDILQINKIEANKLALDKYPFDVRQILSKVVDSLQQPAKEKENNIVLNLDKNIPEMLIGDPLKLSQIFINLVGNALKFTEKGSVTLSAKTAKSTDTDVTIHFEVKDEGIGISEEMQKNIFDSFSQGSEQINRKYGGTGLGLTIVKSLLTLYDSQISVDSELGKGSTFFFDITFELPDDEIKELITAPSKVQEELYANLNILVVEDNKINQVITQKMLSKKGIKCDIASDGYQAIEKAKKGKFDAILMDIHMPGISGLKATQEIRKFNQTIPIIALTAISLDESKDDFYEAGCNDVITKPFKPEVFYKKIAHNVVRNIKVNL